MVTVLGVAPVFCNRAGIGYEHKFKLIAGHFQYIFPNEFKRKEVYLKTAGKAEYKRNG